MFNGRSEIFLRDNDIEEVELEKSEGEPKIKEEEYLMEADANQKKGLCADQNEGHGDEGKSMTDPSSKNQHSRNSSIYDLYKRV